MAWNQLWLAKDLSIRQAQPYVMAFLDYPYDGAEIVNIKVRNFGRTAARNIRFVSDKPLTRTAFAGDSDHVTVRLPDIPMLAPGQEWSTFWDNGLIRSKSNIKDEVITLYISYRDDRNREERSECTLNWNEHFARMFTKPARLEDLIEAIKNLKTS